MNQQIVCIFSRVNLPQRVNIITFTSNFFSSLDVSDLNFLAFVYYVPTKTWMSSVLFDHISACRIVFRSKIVIAVIHFGNVFNSACFIGCLLRNIHRAVNQIYSGREQVQQYFKNSLGILMFLQMRSLKKYF